MCDCGGDCGCSQNMEYIHVTVLPPQPVPNVKLELDRDSAMYLMGLLGNTISKSNAPGIFEALSKAMPGDLMTRRAHLSYKAGHDLIDEIRRNARSR